MHQKLLNMEIVIVIEFKHYCSFYDLFTQIFIKDQRGSIRCLFRSNNLFFQIHPESSPKAHVKVKIRFTY